MIFLDEAEGSFLRAFLGGTAGAVESAFALLFLGLLDSADVLAITWDTKKKQRKIATIFTLLTTNPNMPGLHVFWKTGSWTSEDYAFQ